MDLRDEMACSDGQTKAKTIFRSGKVAILKPHLVNGERVSDICDELSINPNVFYRWQKSLFENGARAFDASNQPKSDGKDRKISLLQSELGERNEVTSDLVTELSKAKKTLGRSEKSLGRTRLSRRSD